MLPSYPSLLSDRITGPATLQVVVGNFTGSVSKWAGWEITNINSKRARALTKKNNHKYNKFKVVEIYLAGNLVLLINIIFWIFTWQAFGMNWRTRVIIFQVNVWQSVKIRVLLIVSGSRYVAHYRLSPLQHLNSSNVQKQSLSRGMSNLVITHVCSNLI